jgi:hypothetical protein
MKYGFVITINAKWIFFRNNLLEIDKNGGLLFRRVVSPLTNHFFLSSHGVGSWLDVRKSAS